MGALTLEPSLAAWILMTLAAFSASLIGKVGLGMLRAYYILRVRAGLPVVLWFPKFWRMDGRRQKGSSLSRVLERMELLGGPHGMYGTVFGTQPVLHVADPEAAALVLSQHTKRPGYDHFGAFFGRGVFTADGEEWRKKRTTVTHALFRGRAPGPSSGESGGVGGEGCGCGGGGGSGSGGGGGGGGGGKSLSVLANEEADSLLKEMEALQQQVKEVMEVEIVRLLQNHTLNLIHRFLCNGEDVCASPQRKRLLPRYLDAVTDMRMVILARSRSVWMFAWGWAYRAFSPFHARETRNMVPIREFAELVLETATAGGSNLDSDVTDGVGNNRSSSPSGGGDHEEGVVGREAVSRPVEEEEHSVEGAAGKALAAPQVTAAANPNTALSNMAARDSHRAYPGSMVDETITLLFAGQDTSAATLSWTMHLLSLPENRPYLAEVRREVLAAVGPDGYVDCARNSSAKQQQQQKRLPMVDACIRESQRLYPVAPFVVRHLTSDLRLKDGTLLPAGALACVWIYGLHRQSSLWESPDVFLPERWLDGARQPAGAFIPYASGPRGCVGRPFAGVALRILLARVCAAFDFSPAPTGADSDTDIATARVCASGVFKAEAEAEAEAAAAGLEREAPPPLESEEVEQQEVIPQEQGKDVLNVDRGCGKKPCKEFSREVGIGLVGTRGGVGGSKEMQAGFTVLPGGGVHLRLRKWEK
ncbi:unnamed protein product [Pylaiella littoralis]